LPFVIDMFDDYFFACEPIQDLNITNFFGIPTSNSVQITVIL